MWKCALGASIGVVGVSSLLLLRASAQESEPDPEPGSEARPASPTARAGWDPFVAYPSHAGAIPYDALVDGPVPDLLAAEERDETIARRQSAEDYFQSTRETRASVDDASEWAEVIVGVDQAEALSRHTRRRAAAARVTRAARTAGTSGLEHVGVE